eukprot:1042940-Amorphochlora_amoeboformis.AAC.3
MRQWRTAAITAWVVISLSFLRGGEMIGGKSDATMGMKMRRRWGAENRRAPSSKFLTFTSLERPTWFSGRFRQIAFSCIPPKFVREN